MKPSRPTSLVPIFTTLIACCIAVAVWIGCPSSSSPNHHVLVGFGETCGRTANYPDPVEATCSLDGGYPNSNLAGGGSCALLDFSHPDGGMGLLVGMCAPRCDTSSSAQACPGGYDCEHVDEREGLASAVCLKPCTTPADCAGPLQVCIGGHCQTHACSSDGDCGPGGRCSDSLCVSGNASTR
jgi:hypothetical protein